MYEHTVERTLRERDSLSTKDTSYSVQQILARFLTSDNLLTKDNERAGPPKIRRFHCI